MCLRAISKNKFFFFASLKSDPELDPDPDPLVRGVDLGIRIRTKMFRIPDT
jgi:hypothetical protein